MEGLRGYRGAVRLEESADSPCRNVGGGRHEEQASCSLRDEQARPDRGSERPALRYRFGNGDHGKREDKQDSCRNPVHCLDRGDHAGQHAASERSDHDAHEASAACDGRPPGSMAGNDGVLDSKRRQRAHGKPARNPLDKACRKNPGRVRCDSEEKASCQGQRQGSKGNRLTAQRIRKASRKQQYGHDAEQVEEHRCVNLQVGQADGLLVDGIQGDRRSACREHGEHGSGRNDETALCLLGVDAANSHGYSCLLPGLR